MFRKFTFFNDPTLKRQLEQTPVLGEMPGYARAIELAGELFRYVALGDQYRTPDWIHRDDTFELAVYKLLARPAESGRHWHEGDSFYAKMRSAYRIECRLHQWFPGKFALEVKFFHKRQQGDARFQEFDINIKTGQVLLGRGTE